MQFYFKQKNRGNYRCSKCNLPKKGHVCPYQPRFRRRDQPIEGAALDAEIQCELDADMTVRMLPLDRQGFPESYMAVNTALLHHQYSGNVPPGVIEGAPFCDGLNASDRGIFHGSTSNVSALPVPTTLSTESISPTSEMGAT